MINTYALLHQCDGEYYWVKCSNHIINDKQVPYKGFWLEKKDNYDDIKGLVTNNDDLLELLSWLNINNKFAKELVAKLHDMVDNKTNEEDINEY